MNDFRIIAGGKVLDTYDDVGVSLNFEIEDILNVEKRKTNFSKTITIPGSKSNNLFFKQIFDVNVDNINYNPNIKVPASITVGSNTVMKGNLQLLKIHNTNGEIDYDVSIFGELNNIISDFKDYTLKNLDFSEYDHTRDKDTIQDSWTYSCDVNGDRVFLGKTGQGYVYPYDVRGDNTDIFDSVYIYDMYPAFYLKTYIDKMFEFAGYTYTSNFFNSEYFKKLIIPFIQDKIEINAEQFEERNVRTSINGNILSGEYKFLTPYKRAVTGANNAAEGWYESWGAGYQLSADGTGFDRETGTVTDGGEDLTFTDELGQWDGNIFTCSKAGRYDINLDGKLFVAYFNTRNSGLMEYNSGNLSYLYRLYLHKVDGSVIELDSTRDPDDPSNPDGVIDFVPSAFSETASNWQDPNAPFIDLDSPLVFGLSASNVFLEPGDEIKVLVAFRQQPNVSWAGDDWKTYAALVLKESFDGSFTKMIIKPSSNQSYGNEDLKVNNLLNDTIKIKDMFLDVVKMFNLIIQDDPNNERNLIIEPRDDFFKSKQKVKDWTKLVDRSKDLVITPMSELDARTYLYTYTQDDDLYNKEYNAETKKIYAEQEINVLNDFSKKLQKTEVKFSPTPCSSHLINGRVAPFYVEKDDENYKAKKVKPRILFYDGLKSIEADSLLLKENISDSGTGLSSYPYAGMWDDPYNPQESLDFGAPDKIYWNPAVYPASNLYRKFHRATLNNITDKNSRLLECFVKLTSLDIAQFDFRDLIKIDGSYWRVMNIKDFNPIGSDKLTKVVLYKIIDLTVINKYNVVLPVSNTDCPNDLIVADIKDRQYYKSTSGQFISEDCCNALGGEYGQGVCYLPADGGINPIDLEGDVITTGLTPTQSKNGAEYQGRDGNSINSLGVKVQGTGNYVPPGVKQGIIVGNNNTVLPGVDGFISVGDGNLIDESGAVYVDGTKITDEGISNPSKITIIDGGEDEVMAIDKTNLIDVIDGGEDSVRNYEGDSKKRVIIDGTQNSATQGEIQG